MRVLSAYSEAEHSSISRGIQLELNFRHRGTSVSKIYHQNLTLRLCKPFALVQRKLGEATPRRRKVQQSLRAAFCKPFGLVQRKTWGGQASQKRSLQQWLRAPGRQSGSLRAQRRPKGRQKGSAQKHEEVGPVHSSGRDQR